MCKLWSQILKIYKQDFDTPDRECFYYKQKGENKLNKNSFYIKPEAILDKIKFKNNIKGGQSDE